ncbi:MAG: RNA methyltransferase [Papillibacter sp.]|jgi:TrmH family RNA methyltransferase|nr:RNA methyltransferase [Papillibacter sp.]
MEVIKSRKNQLVLHMRKLGTDKAYRGETGLYLCQGEKLLYEAIENRAVINEVLYSGTKPVLPEDTRAYPAAFDILEYVSPFQSAPELVFSCKIPADSALPVSGRAVILEDLQDPGNVGTIMRTAAAFGFGTVIFAGDCADPYNPKTVRASMGACFKTHICRVKTGELSKLRLPIYASALSNESVLLSDVTLPPDFAFAVGNEGHGLSSELLSISEKIIKIPMEPGSESLNAAIAAAVLMWEAYVKTEFSRGK